MLHCRLVVVWHFTNIGQEGMTCHCLIVWISCSATYSFHREHECHICYRTPWKIVSFSSHLYWDQYENVISCYAMELIRQLAFLLEIIMRFMWRWDSSVHNFIAISQELLAIFCLYKFWRSVSRHEPLFSQVTIGTVTTRMSVATALSVAHLFLSKWLHQTENTVLYDCDVRAWLLCRQVQHRDTYLFSNCWGTTLMRMHSRWLATVLQHFVITHFILTIIEINMILFRVWITEQNFAQNIWWKWDNLEQPAIRWKDDTEVDL